MEWAEVAIRVDRQAAAVAELALEQQGALAVTLEDDGDRPVLEPAAGATPLWPTVRVRGLFDAGVDRSAVLTALGVVPGAGRPGIIRWREIGDRDWERAWLDRFEPMRFGRRLWVVPGDARIPLEPDTIEIRLDPGLAFGTGSHPTTALCLEWLDGRDTAGSTVVDYGCGSGVLAIAAALIGARRVACVDTDAQALETTRENAARNGVSEAIECHAPEALPPIEAEIVMANILAGPLIGLAPELTGLLAPGASLVLSGILAEQVDEVAAAYRDTIEWQAPVLREEWALLSGRRASG